jgi:hypothetical protein
MWAIVIRFDQSVQSHTLVMFVIIFAFEIVNYILFASIGKVQQLAGTPAQNKCRGINVLQFDYRHVHTTI